MQLSLGMENVVKMELRLQRLVLFGKQNAELCFVKRMFGKNVSVKKNGEKGRFPFHHSRWLIFRVQNFGIANKNLSFIRFQLINFPAFTDSMNAVGFG